jgi:tRNA(fMet)-specific endonuclease VapC
LLDTNICIYIINKKPIQVIQKIISFEVSEICISSITLSELEYGVEKSKAPEKNRMALNEFLAPFEILPFDNICALMYGKIRASLEKIGSVIGPLDLLIAAHCLSVNYTLVTNNEKEFCRINGLKIENWIE